MKEKKIIKDGVVTVSDKVDKVAYITISKQCYKLVRSLTERLEKGKLSSLPEIQTAYTIDPNRIDIKARPIVGSLDETYRDWIDKAKKKNFRLAERPARHGMVSCKSEEIEPLKELLTLIRQQMTVAQFLAELKGEK